MYGSKFANISFSPLLKSHMLDVDFDLDDNKAFVLIHNEKDEWDIATMAADHLLPGKNSDNQDDNNSGLHSRKRRGAIATVSLCLVIFWIDR